MGNDGGSIPRRDELVKTKQKKEQKDKDSDRLTRWQHCHLTQEALGRRIVACQLGRLYKKEAIIERLLDQEKPFPPDCNHIKSIKDVKDLELVENPSYENRNPSKGDNYIDSSIAPWICPMTGIEMNGRFKFVFDWKTGKVLSEKANKLVKRDDPMKISEENVIILNPESEDASLMLTKMEARKAREKALKKAKKELKRGVDAVPIKNGADEPFKKPKISGNLTSNIPPPPTSEKLSVKLGSVQKDPSKSEVYKSLFSSHKSAQNKPKGHWVTFDPRYN
ncbi:hypothetical protein TCAL_06247 [Tigriopus californicus]|uniref:Replication termination factor 2 n=1 Tax=Tigriopus californicus TaxID=6832 RepID=A0A553N7M2_TIGCA|nr:replication termination factor 2-like [Tigriopus californicus]TRY61444.1 hypothetical protein TCAL_06247 [Tigriopus californicus]